MEYNDALPVLKERYVARNHGVLSLMSLAEASTRFSACAWLSFVPIVMPPCDYVAIGLCYYHGNALGSALTGRWNAGHVSQRRLVEILGSLISEQSDPVVHLVYSGGMTQGQAETIIDEALKQRALPHG